MVELVLVKDLEGQNGVALDLQIHETLELDLLDDSLLCFVPAHILLAHFHIDCTAEDIAHSNSAHLDHNIEDHEDDNTDCFHH